jgi:hypothetical protein
MLGHSSSGSGAAATASGPPKLFSGLAASHRAFSDSCSRYGSSSTNAEVYRPSEFGWAMPGGSFFLAAW